MMHNRKLKTLAALSTFFLCMPLTAFESKVEKQFFKPDSRNNDYTVAKHLLSGGEICGTTEENGHLWQPIPINNLVTVAAKSSYWAISGKSQGLTDTGEYIIPVVFHIYGSAHNCSDDDGECVTDDIIKDALRRTNEDFQGLNNLDGPISAQFGAIRDNLNIEFVLAKIDPDGNPTNGIIRQGDESGQGNGGDNQVVMANAWDNYKYMNVYVVNDLYDDGKQTNSGVAWYPSTNMSDKGLARVVYNGGYLGKNSNENFRSLLSHEFGHWLNLPHTFSGNACNAPGLTFCAFEGDRVCDTPQMSNSSMANNAPNCLDQPTNTENFMHYSDNYAMFTQQQVQRMTAALHHPARAALWQNENLTTTGLVDFSSDEPRVFDGTTGTDHRPEGEVLLEVNDLTARAGYVSSHTVKIPEGVEAVIIYLDGFNEDPDLYVSYGTPPVKDENGKWSSERLSFNDTGNNEFIGILNPQKSGSYYITIDAYSTYSNARLSVVAIADPSNCAACERTRLHDEMALSAQSNDEPKVLSFIIPDDAILVAFEIPEGYFGDPDLHVSHNSIPIVNEADCLPWQGSGERELCEFRGENLGGTYNVLVNPFEDYSGVSFNVYYTRVNPDSRAANTAPLAKTESSFSGIENIAIDFNSEGSSDIDGHIVSYLWNFGDGNTSRREKPSHSYDNYGSYTANLTVEDDDGATHSQTTLVYVGKQASYCEVVADSDYEHIQVVRFGSLDHASNANGYQDFTALTTHVGTGNYLLTVLGAGPLSGQHTEYWNVWIDFNGDDDFSDDGEAVAAFSSFGVTSQTINIDESHQGLTPRMRIAMNHNGYTDTACEPGVEGEYEDYTLYINTSPIAKVNGSYSNLLGEITNFSSDGSSDAEGIISYSWIFGDGNNSNQQNPSHTYTTAGNFTVTLTVIDTFGATTSDSTLVTVIEVTTDPVDKVTPESSNDSGGSMGLLTLLLSIFSLGKRLNRC